MSDSAVPVTERPGWRTGDAATGRGRPAESQVRPEQPAAVVLPDGTRMPVVPVDTRPDGALELPSDVGTAGWWTGGSRLGDPYGAVVLAAHVDSLDQGLGPFARLLTMRPGERVRLESLTKVSDFEVVTRRSVHRESLSEDVDAFARTGPARLVLITCGGPYDADAGGYRDNVVVVASSTGEGG